MGPIIRKVNAGAVKGLRDLGLLPEGSSRPEAAQATAAFKEAYQYVLERLKEHPEEAKKIEWDPIVLEHTLCKFKRLNIVQKGVPE